MCQRRMCAVGFVESARAFVYCGHSSVNFYCSNNVLCLCTGLVTVFVKREDSDSVNNCLCVCMVLCIA